MSEITERIRQYHSSKTGWDSLKLWLANRTYPIPERYSQPRDESSDLVSYSEGTWDEVRRARNIGLLTDDEYMSIVNDADAAVATGSLNKEWTASTVATSGITSYGSTKKRQRRRVKLLPKKEKQNGS